MLIKNEKPGNCLRKYGFGKCEDLKMLLFALKILTLFPLRYLGPLYQFERWEGGKITPSPLVFSRSGCPIHFKLGKYLTHHKFFQNKSKWYPRSRDFFNYVIIFREI